MKAGINDLVVVRIGDTIHAMHAVCAHAGGPLTRGRSWTGASSARGTAPATGWPMGMWSAGLPSTTSRRTRSAPPRAAATRSGARRARSLRQTRDQAPGRGVVDDRRRIVDADPQPAAACSRGVISQGAWMVRPGRRAAPEPSAARSRRRGRTAGPGSTGLKIRKYGWASVPVEAAHCQPPLLRGEVAVDQVAHEAGLADPPVDQQVLGQERRDDHPRAVVHPAGRASWRIAASTIG